MTAATSGVLCPLVVPVSASPELQQFAQQVQNFQTFITNPTNSSQVSGVPQPPKSTGVYSLKTDGKGHNSWYALGIPSADGTYQLVITGGVATWASGEVLPALPGSDGVYHLEVSSGVGSWIVDPLPDPPGTDSVAFLTVIGGVTGWSYTPYSSLVSGLHNYFVQVDTVTGAVSFGAFPDVPTGGSVYTLQAVGGVLQWTFIS